MENISINGKSYAVGLWWQVSDNSGKGRRKDMLTAARISAAQQAHEEYNCVVLRKYQFGLGHADTFQALPALAASLRPKELPFVGLFRVSGDTIGSFWWLCGITKGGIIAGDGDMLYEDRDTALQRVESLLHVFGNISLAYDCDTSEESAQALAPLLNPDGKLERLHADPRQQHVRVAALTLAGLLVAGAWAYDYYTTQQAEHMRQAHMLAMQKAQQGKRSEAQSNIERYFTKHWEQAPTVQHVAQQCFSQVYDTPSVEQGWLLESSLCQKNSLTLAWSHAQGASYITLPNKALLNASSPTKAIATHDLPIIPPKRGKLAYGLFSKAQVMGQLYQATQDVGASLRLQWVAAESIKVEDVPLTAPWVRCGWELSSVPNMGIHELIEILDAFPSLTVESILLQKNTWTLKGAVYAAQ